MDDMTMDFSGGPSGPKLMPTGEYQAVFNSWEKKAFSTGSTGATLEFGILEEEFEGKLMWANLVYSEKTKWKIEEFLLALNIWSKEELYVSDFNVGEAFDEAIGAELTLRVGQHMWDGEKRNNVKKFLPA